MDASRDRLKNVREIKGLTQAQFGEKLGLNWQQIKNRETGIVKIDLFFAKAVYYAFGISPDWLLHGKGEMLAGEGEEGATIPSEHRSYVDKLVAILNKGNREKVGRLKERIDLYYEEIQEKEVRGREAQKKGA